MTAAELSELADAFYDKDGRPIHSASSATGVNAIGGGDSASFNPNASSNAPSTTGSFTSAFESEQTDVNAVRDRQRPKQTYNSRSNNNNNNRPSGSNSNARSFSSNNNDRFDNKQSSKIKSNGLCFYHDKFGEDARSCANGCKRWSTHQAGNGRAGK